MEVSIKLGFCFFGATSRFANTFFGTRDEPPRFAALLPRVDAASIWNLAGDGAEEAVVIMVGGSADELDAVRSIGVPCKDEIKKCVTIYETIFTYSVTRPTSLFRYRRLALGSFFPKSLEDVLLGLLLGLLLVANEYVIG